MDGWDAVLATYIAVLIIYVVDVDYVVEEFLATSS